VADTDPRLVQPVFRSTDAKGQPVTPDQAVRDWLRKMSEVPTTTSADVGPDGPGLTTPPFPPVLSSMEVLKHRKGDARQVYAVAYEDAGGNPWFWIVRLIEDEAGSWRVCGGGGGSEDPHFDSPVINYAGCWGNDGLALGGRVTGTGAERACSARLSIRDTVLVDDVGGGVVLFVTSEPTAGSRATMELLAGDGSCLWRDVLELDE
jgi:hypothetical protein